MRAGLDLSLLHADVRERSREIDMSPGNALGLQLILITRTYGVG